MFYPGGNCKSVLSHSRLILVALVFALAITLVSCGQKETKTTEKAAEPAGANVVQQTFASPDAAGSALLEAAKADDPNELLAVFGPDAKGWLSSGDAVKDKNTLQAFVNAYGEMHRWSKRKDGSEVLFVGADNFPFPIPLDQNASGQWAFNATAGKQEILARRIGNDELTTIGVLGDIVNAQLEYFGQNHQFALKFVSDEGQHNGLYWPAAEGQRPSPLDQLGEVAKALGYSRSDKPQPFNGYYYKVLTQQGATAKGGARDYMSDGKLTGGFAVLAWPDKYRDSGIMTFMVGKDGVIYQKDLGEKTSEEAAAITAYNPGEGWTVVLKPEPGNAAAGTKTARK
jgi:hypothetical protein